MTGCSGPKEFSQTNPPEKGDKIAVVETSMGTIKFRMFPDLVPETTKNFETLANDSKYDGSPFHRLVKDFVIQGGDFTKGDGTGGHSYKGPGTTIDEETVPELKHIKGSVSMAKTAIPGSTGGQFFFVLPEGGTPFLDGGYSVFGQIFEGMDVLDAMGKAATGVNDRPREDITMTKVSVVEHE